MMVLVTGGSGSGKSFLAEQISVRLKPKEAPLYYLATMKCWDEECQKRISKHRAQRAGKNFCTIEVPDHLTEIAGSLCPNGCALLDCISNLMANEQFEVQAADPIHAVTDGVLAVQKKLRHLVVVTNEVCSDGVPGDLSMQKYLQYIGAVNCMLAAAADVVIEVCCGIPIFWKGEKQYHEVMDGIISDCIFYV